VTAHLRAAAWPAFARRFAPIVLPLQRLFLRRRVGRLVVEQVDGVSLVILPDVFNGVIFESGPLVARAVAAWPHVDAGARALDMGTGSGVGAIFAARRGFDVVAVDINPEAVRCARINALLNHVDARIDVRHGDLFEAVAGERFDLVLFNPPFFDGEPRSLRDLAWRGTGVIERFVDGLPSVLTEEGSALIVLSSRGGPEAIVGALGARAGVHQAGTGGGYDT
jgi:release factor glutamine methyltransferase